MEFLIYDNVILTGLVEVQTSALLKPISLDLRKTLSLFFSSLAFVVSIVPSNGS